MKKLSPKQRRWLKRLLVLLGLGLLVPVVEIVVVRFVAPPTTLPKTLRWFQGQTNHSEWVKLAKVSEPYLVAVYISEDRHFFQHHGFDWEEIQKARAEASVTGKPARGASTITQQCARSVFLWQGRSWFRKGLEAYYTVWMELLLSKERILELYVNAIELGDGVYGIEAAAQKYYGISADKLTKEQAAMLVAIMPNPKQWNPLQPNERVLKRQAVILQRSEYAQLPIKLHQ